MFGKFFKSWREGKAEQMGDGENDFRKTVRIGRVNIAFDRFVMKQSVNNVSRFTFRTADDGRIEKQMSFVNKAVNGYSFVLSEVFKGIIGI